MAKPSPARQIAWNTAVQFAGKMIALTLGLVTIGFITRYLGVVGFGHYTTIFVYVSFLAVFADFGFFAVLVTQLAASRGDPQKIISNIITLRGLLAIGVYVIGFLVGFLLPYPDAVSWGIGIIAAAWFGQTVNQTIVGVFQVKQAMAKPVLADIVGRAVVLLLVYQATRLNLPLSALLVAYLAGAGATLLLNLAFVRQFVTVGLAFDLKYWRKIAELALPMAAVLILGFIYFKADSVILSLLKRPQDVGIYGVPYKLIEVFLLFPSIFMGTVLPLMSRYLANHDPKIKAAFAKAFDFLFLMGLPVLVVGWLLAKPLVHVLGGEAFISTATVTIGSHPVGAVILLQILLIAVFLSYLSHLTTYVVVAASRQKDLVLPNLAFVVLNVGLNFLFIPQYSYLAAAVITVLTELAVLVVSYGIIIKRIGWLLPDLTFIGKVVLINFILAVMLVPLREAPLAISGTLAVVGYAVLIVAFRLIPKEFLANVLQLT